MGTKFPQFFLQLNIYDRIPNLTSSPARGCLLITIAADPRQRSHSHVRIPRNSQPNSTLSDSRLLKRGRPGVRIYIPQNGVARFFHQTMESNLLLLFLCSLLINGLFTENLCLWGGFYRTVA
jgi:hypothetical protein